MYDYTGSNSKFAWTSHKSAEKKNDSEIAGWKASWKSQKATQWLGPSLLPLHSQRKGRAKSWESRLAHASEVQRKGYQDTKF